MSKESRPLFDRICNALCTNEFTGLQNDFTETARIENSLSGEGHGYEDFVRLFQYRGIGSDCVKTNIENVLERENASKAAYSFHLLRQYCAWDAHQFMHYLQYGATVAVKMKKQEVSWKIEQITFELAWVDGNTEWMHQYSLIDYRVPRVMPKLIQAKEEGVVNIIHLDPDDREDIDKIREVLFVYGWFVDYEDYEAFEKVAADDLKIVDGFHNQIIESRDAWISFVKSLHLKESFLHHTYRITSYDIQEDHARVEMSRVEPNRIGSKVINASNYRYDWYTMDLHMDLEKKDKQWILVKAKLVKNIRPVPSNGYLYKERRL